MTDAETHDLERAIMLRNGARKQCDRMRKRLFALRDDLKDLIGKRPGPDAAETLLHKHFPASVDTTDTTDPNGATTSDGILWRTPLGGAKSRAG